MNQPLPPDHWTGIAKLWEHVGPPLKASAEDLDHYLKAALTWQGGSPPRVLIMGVTQELYHLAWPEGAHLMALDNSREMIDRVWPGPAGDAFFGDWREMPFASDSRDIAVCDGGLTLLTYPEGVQQTASELNRVLSKGGLCVFRLYTPPEDREEPECVFEDLAQGRIPDLSHFKLRIGNAMQTSPRYGVVLADIWRALNEIAPDLDALAGRIGWPSDHLKAIDTYRDSPNVYRFLSIEEVREVFESPQFGFRLQGVWTSSPSLPQNCPVVAFRRE